MNKTFLWLLGLIVLVVLVLGINPLASEQPAAPTPETAKQWTPNLPGSTVNKADVNADIEVAPVIQFGLVNHNGDIQIGDNDQSTTTTNTDARSFDLSNNPVTTASKVEANGIGGKVEANGAFNLDQTAKPILPGSTPLQPQKTPEKSLLQKVLGFLHIPGF